MAHLRHQSSANIGRKDQSQIDGDGRIAVRRRLQTSDRRTTAACPQEPSENSSGNSRCGSGLDGPLLGFIAEKRPLKVRFPEAATRQ